MAARTYNPAKSPSGTRNASCGLTAIRVRIMPARIGEPRRKHHQTSASAAPNSITTWPSSREKATRGRASAIPSCMLRCHREPGASSRQVTSTATPSSTFQIA